MEAVELDGRLSIEDYVKTLAARVDLPAPVVKSVVEILERNKRFRLVRIRGFLRQRCGWHRLRSWAF